MTVNRSDRKLAAVVARSNMGDPARRPADLADQLEEVCRPMAGGTDAILEVSRVGLHKTPDGHALGTDDAVLVVFRFEMALVRWRGFVRRRLEVVRIPYEDAGTPCADERGFGDDGKAGEYAIQFLEAGTVPQFRLAWGWWRRVLSTGVVERAAAASERDRILEVLERVVEGDLSAWDTSAAVLAGASFDEAFAAAYECISEAAPRGDRSARREWAETTFPPFPPGGPEHTALEWYEAELDDAAPSRQPGPAIAHRASTIWTSGWMVERSPDAVVTVLRLGQQLLDEGALAPPYDERLSGDDRPRALDPYDPGPSRLAAIVTLADYARRAGHPLAGRWTALALQAASDDPAGAASLAPVARRRLDALR